jgi:serine/threonine protein kinase
MESDGWRRLDDLFQAALDCSPERRASFLEAACEGDRELRETVESLLAAYDESRFTDAPGFADGVRVLDRAQRSSDSRIGPYQVIREIGRGGMGTVYLAARADAAFEKRVAIKIIRRGLDADDVVQRFRSERQILATLDHPNITRLLDAGTTDDGTPYVVMELIEGEPIDEYCDRRKLPIAERLKLFEAVCAAVRYAHQNLVIHRDIKPGHVLVTGEGVPRLLDFGIAKLLAPGAAETDRTRTGLRPLTPEYASPEQVRGEVITTAADVYSLGVLLYVLLTGHRPYRGAMTSAAEIERAICEEEPERPSVAVMREAAREGGSDANRAPVHEARGESTPAKLRRRLDGDVDAIVLKALQKEPQRRYGSVEQLTDDLRRHLEGRPISAHAPTWRYSAGKFVRRHGSAVAASTLIVLSLAGGVVATARQAGIARAERARAERQFDRIRALGTSFLFEFHSAIQDLPGSTPARKLLVQRALEYLGKLSEEAQGNRRLRLEVAEAYLKVGDVQGNPYAPNLGDNEGAAASYGKALGISRSLVAGDAGDAEAVRYLARSYRALGDVLPQLGRPVEAIANFRQAIAMFESIGRTTPDPRLREELAGSYQELGDLQGHNGLQNLGDPVGAIRSYRQSLSLYEALAVADPSSRAARHRAGADPDRRHGGDSRRSE